MKTFKQYLLEDNEFTENEIIDRFTKLIGIKPSDVDYFYGNYSGRGSTKHKVMFWTNLSSNNPPIEVGLKSTRSFFDSFKICCDVDKDITKITSTPYFVFEGLGMHFTCHKNYFSTFISNLTNGKKIFDEISKNIESFFNTKKTVEIKKFIDDYAKKVDKNTFEIKLTDDYDIWRDLVVIVKENKSRNAKTNRVLFCIMYSRDDKTDTLTKIYQNKTFETNDANSDAEKIKLFDNVIKDLKNAESIIRKIKI